MSLPTGTITGKFVDASGDPIKGSVTIAPEPAHLLLANTDPAVTVPAGRVTVELVDGVMPETQVVATDSDQVNPSDFTYMVAFLFPNAALAPFHIKVPAGQTVDLAQAAPAAASNGTAVVVATVNGKTGAVQLDAADVGARPDTWTPTWGQVSSKPMFDVTDYGAVGDGTTDDRNAIQAAINAMQDNGGGTLVIPPRTYLHSGTLVFTPSRGDSEFTIHAYGARLHYTGTGDAVKVNTNIADNIQSGEKTVHFQGLHITGTSAAACGIRNYGCSRATFTNTTLDGFTSTTDGNAALILDARFHQWVEECHFDGLEITNTGNGVLFVSEDDGTNPQGSVAASCMGNVFTAASIWITQDGGRGLYGIGNGTSGLVQIARSVFTSVIVHPYQAANVTAFDLSACYCEGTQFNAPGIDFYGDAPGLTGFLYNGSNVLTIVAATVFPAADTTTFFSGSGRYVILGGNTAQSVTIDPNGNMYAPSLTLGYDLYDRNGAAWIHQSPVAGAINRLSVGNATSGGDPWLTADGADADVGLNIYGKGSGQVKVNGTVPAPFTPATAGQWMQFVGYGDTLPASGGKGDVFLLQGSGVQIHDGTDWVALTE